MTIQEFKDVVIEAGIMSVHQTEKREHRIRGCLAGFAVAKTLHSHHDFEKELLNRAIEENLLSRMASNSQKNESGRDAAERYIEFRCATLQIEYVYDRMKVAWHYNHLHHFDSLSSRAVLHYGQIVGVGPLD